MLRFVATLLNKNVVVIRKTVVRSLSFLSLSLLFSLFTGEDSCVDAHCFQFLEKQFAGVGDVNAADFVWFLAILVEAFNVSALVAVRSHAADFTDLDSVPIAVHEESIADEVSTSVGDKAITFHLSHPQTSVLGASFHRLAGQVA